MSGWPFDSERVWIGVPWHDEGEGYDEVRGTAVIVERALDAADAKRQMQEQTSAEWVDLLEVRRPGTGWPA